MTTKSDNRAKLCVYEKFCEQLCVCAGNFGFQRHSFIKFVLYQHMNYRREKQNHANAFQVFLIGFFVVFTVMQIFSFSSSGLYGFLLHKTVCISQIKVLLWFHLMQT
jgi:hypothetical protein